MDLHTPISRLDCYAVLGVSEGATLTQIKAAYRTRAQQYHPDRNPDNPAAEEQFKALQEAYDVLSDERKRAVYDLQRQASRPPKPVRQSDLLEEVVIRISSIFSELFGTGLPKVQIPLETALRGGPVRIKLKDGTSLRLVLPAGLKDGTHVCVPEVSEHARIIFKVRPHPVFTRKGKHLRMSLSVDALSALLGTSRMIEDPYGELVVIEIPPHTYPGTRLRLSGRGVRGTTGDLIVVLRIEPLSRSRLARLRQAAVQAGLMPPH
ncbi:MAG: DnaJ domain-containing protein [Bacteroidota bacterium]|nr:DnaJ domain-containing protein [Bacteroidota bacterium]MDE2957272.1 DnaJ domain-containing protein [Bacteroidota bacterium]